MKAALINSQNVVENVIVWDSTCVAPTGLTAITLDDSIVVSPGWIYGGATTFTNPNPPPVTPSVPSSVAVQSTSTPALDGTYSIAPDARSNVMAVSLYISINGKFPAGQTAFPWLDVNGSPHAFGSTTQFQAFATALADYAAALDLGQTPATPITIP